jgi:hypothetical protein
MFAAIMTSRLAEGHQSRPPTAGFQGRVGKAENKRRLRQDGPHNFALDPNSPAMDDPQRPKPHPMRFFQVVFDNWLHFARRNRVQVKDVGHRNANWLFFHTGALFTLRCC